MTEVPATDAGARFSSWRSWLGAAFIAWLALMVVSGIAAPPMSGPDEPEHAVYSAAVARGQLASEVRVQVEADEFRRSLTDVAVPQAYAELAGVPLCHAGMREVSADCSPPIADTDGPTTAATTTAGQYLPAYYALVGWPTRILNPPRALAASRAVGAVLSALLLTVAIGLARRVAGTPGALAVVVAVTPMTIFLGGVINPSGLEIAASIVVWVSLLAGVRMGDWTRDVRWSLGVGIAVLISARPSGVVWASVIVAAVAGAAGLAESGRVLRRQVAIPNVRRGIGAVVVLGITVTSFLLVRGTWGSFSGTPFRGSGGDVVAESLGMLPDRVVQMVGTFGWADAPLPVWVAVAWFGGWAALGISSLPRRSPRQLMTLVAVGLGVIAIPVLADLRSASEIGLAWQGRYTLPLAVGLPLMAVLLPGADASPESRRVSEGLVSVIVVLGHVLAIVTLLARYELGRGPTLEVFGSGTWEPAVADGLLVVVGAGAALALVVLSRRRIGP